MEKGTSQESQPRVSVILPVYNVEQYLAGCLDSIVNQTLRNIEIICVDDCSQDNSQNILKEYAAKDIRFVLIQQPTNQGQGEARNAGIDCALGKYIFFIDPDDLFYDSTSLEILFSIAEKNQDDMVIGNTRFFSEQKENTWFLYPDIFAKDRQSTTLNEFPELIQMNTVWNRLIQTEMLRANNIRFLAPRYGADISFSMYSTYYAKSISLTKKCTMRYRAGGDFSGATPQRVEDAREHILSQIEFLKHNGSPQLLEQMQIKVLKSLEFRHRRALAAGMKKENQIKELEIWQKVIDAFPEIEISQLNELEYKFSRYVKDADFEGALQCHTAVLQGQLQSLRIANRKLAYQLDGLMDSTSWRITAPLRWVGKKVRRVESKLEQKSF